MFGEDSQINPSLLDIVKHIAQNVRSIDPDVRDSAVKMFEQWWKSTGQDESDSPNYESFKRFMEKNDVGKGSIDDVLSALDAIGSKGVSVGMFQKNVFRYVREVDEAEPLPIANPSKLKLSEGDCAKLLAITNSRRTYTESKDSVIVHLALMCGITPREMAHIALGDMKWDARCIIELANKKGVKLRVCNRATEDALLAYLWDYIFLKGQLCSELVAKDGIGKWLEKFKTHPLITANMKDRRPMTSRSVRRRLRILMDEAGITKDINPKALNDAMYEAIIRGGGRKRDVLVLKGLIAPCESNLQTRVLNPVEDLIKYQANEQPRSKLGFCT